MAASICYAFDRIGAPAGDIDTVIKEHLEDLQAKHDQRKYAIWLHNDPLNNFDYVIEVLKEVFGFSGGKAFWLTLRAHTFGRSKLWVGGRKEASARADMVIAKGPDPRVIASGAQPLRVTVERLG